MKTLLVATALALAGASTAAAQVEPARAGDPRPPPPETAAAAAAPVQATPAVIILKDGQQLRGLLVSQGEAGATLDLEGGARLLVPTESIARIELAPVQPSVRRPSDPSRTRYLFSPSAFMLAQGEGYISQTELLVTSAALGLTDHLTVGAGTCLPALFSAGGDGTNFIGTVKAGGSVGEHLHLAIGAQGLVLPASGFSGGLLFGTAAIGTPDAHLSLSAGPPLTSDGDRGPLLVSVSGALRVADRIALVTENWIIPGGEEPINIFSGAVRFIGRGLAVDAGLVALEGFPVALPWLDFTWRVGG